MELVAVDRSDPNGGWGWDFAAANLCATDRHVPGTVRDKLRRSYDYLFLSPHLDDVVLSCGGFLWQITEAGRSAIVVSFFAGDPPHGALSPLARTAHDLWGLRGNAMHVRRSEDARACTALGAHFLHMGMMDCVYRRDPRSHSPLYPAQKDVFGPIHPIDLEAALKPLSELVRALPSAHHVLAPLALGDHVDHQLLRMAVQRSSFGPVSFYEDYPYCTAVQVRSPPRTRAKVHAVTTQALEHKLRAIQAYESQVEPVFSGHENIRRRMTAYLDATGGERLWHPVEANNG